jgi:hypothetical protein
VTVGCPRRDHAAAVRAPDADREPAAVSSAILAGCRRSITACEIGCREPRHCQPPSSQRARLVDQLAADGLARDAIAPGAVPRALR